MIQITSQNQKIDSCNIHYLTAGIPRSSTIILLHGMKFQAATWQELGTLAKIAGAGFYAAAIDMPGFGKSPPCFMDQGRVLEQFIRTIGQQSAFLVGPSMGGRIALEFTISHPDLVKGLVLVGAVGVAENKTRLASINVPTLIVWGGNDQISPLSNSDILHTSITNSKKIVIDGAPHPCYLDNPEQWHNALIEFLTSYND